MSQSSQKSPPVTASGRKTPFWWLVIGAWTILASIMASQLVFHRPQTGWLTALVFEALYCAQWVGVLPFTLFLVRRFPFERKKWAATVFVHVAAAIFLSAITMAVRALFTWILLDNMQTSLSVGAITRNMVSAFDYGVMSYLLNLLFGYSFVYYDQLRQRERRALQLEGELRAAQLQALKMHLHPHFLFNTLHAVAVLIRKSEHDAAIDMINRLSKFLRYTLESVHSQEVSLKEEMETTDLYLDIQQARFNDRLRITRQISPAVADALVPTLLLQPLVENALRHGIATSETAGSVAISAVRENGVVHISVADDGPGVRENWSLLLEKGVGLTNTVSRLEKLYGARCRFELKNNPGSGATAHVVIPYHEQPFKTSGDAG